MTSTAEARLVADVVGSTRAVFDRLMADGPGQAEDQALQAGLGVRSNYYIDDPVEARNWAVFASRLAAARRAGAGRAVLVAACGDGLETELLARAGYDVTAFDVSSAAVARTRERLADAGLTADLRVDDLAALHLDRYRRFYAGVVFAQASCFLPVVSGDEVFETALTALASLTAGVFWYSTTWYLAPVYARRWCSGDVVVGETPLYRRHLDQARRLVSAAGLREVHVDQYVSGPGADDYRNDYLVAVGAALAG